MALPIGILSQTVTVKRRVTQGRDSLNNPTYGAPTTGDGWNTVYENVPCRLAFTSKSIMFAHEGERLQPSGTMYYPSDYSLSAEDRIITSDGIEYTVIAISTGRAMGGVISHYEAVLQLP